MSAEPTPTPAPLPVIFVVVEETEAGSYCTGDTYIVLAYYTTRAAAEAAVAAWKEAHEGNSSETHAFEDEPAEGDEDEDLDSDWCPTCGCDAVIHEVEGGAQ